MSISFELYLARLKKSGANLGLSSIASVNNFMASSRFPVVQQTVMYPIDVFQKVGDINNETLRYVSQSIIDKHLVTTYVPQSV